MYTQKQLGEELKTLLTKPFDGIKITRWAEHISTIHCKELSSELDDIIMGLSAMEHGPEFEYTLQELRLLAELLINEERRFGGINETLQNSESYPPYPLIIGHGCVKTACKKAMQEIEGEDKPKSFMQPTLFEYNENEISWTVYNFD